MDVAAGTGSDGAEKVSGDDGVSVGTADSPGRFRGDAAGAVRAEAAADSLQAEGALGTLAVYPVVGSFHGKSGDELL